MAEIEKKPASVAPSLLEGDTDHDPTDNPDSLRRKLNNRQIQLIAIGGSIGTATFISIGAALASGGPGSLLIAFTIYACVMGLVNNSMAEMNTLMPVAGGFIRLAGLWVDDALGFMAGWNFFIYEALLIPFEITALNVVLSFWNEEITKPGPTAAVCAACIVSYGILNALTVSSYGEAEFWLSGGKVILIFMLFAFTFVTMVGGNPQGDAYGFRYWNNPGAFAEHLSTGNIGRFEGFLACLWSAGFTIVGPEYVSMVAAEAKRPRTYIKQAFKTAYFRFGMFFIMGAFCVGTIVPYNDTVLNAIVGGEAKGSGTAAASPYVIAMDRMNVKILPHITNFLIFTSIYSAGNTYTYCAIRSLHGLALEGRAPRILTKCTKNGVPIYCYAVVMCFPFLSFLQVSNGSAQVLTWLVNLITAGGIINFIIMSITFLFFYRACKAQGVDRQSFPYTGYFQPYGAWIALVVQIIVVVFYGYPAFRPWNIETFFSCYTIVFVSPMLFVFWKFFKKTEFVKPLEADLVYQRPLIDAYEDSIKTPPVGFWREMGQMVGIRRRKKVVQQEAPVVVEGEK